MELSSEAIHDIIHPTAAFAFQDVDVETTISDAPIDGDDSGTSWEESQLNPKNRVDSLDEHESQLWRIDGCTGLGTQFYLVPQFLDRVPPFRVDAFIPPQSLQPRFLRSILELDIAFHTKDKSRVRQLAISRLIVRKLQRWTRALPDPGAWYKSLRYGSRIVFLNLSLNLDSIDIQIADTWYLEQQLLSPLTLAAMWGPEINLPPQIDFLEVHVVEQIHDSVCLVQIQGQLWILKALTSFTKYLYHELKQLLSITPHPNIVSSPGHLVTKLCTFGQSTKVIGFTLKYHQHGSLRDVVPFLRIHHQLSLSDEIKWSLQLARALEHLRLTSKTFYPDLRLDNIVLSDSSDAIMVDFEQRGVWAEFAAPEVNYIEYVRILAAYEDIPDDIRERYAAMLESMLPNYEALVHRESYTNPPESYNIPWLCLSPTEQEAAEVYMLGRVLWCLFEGVSAPQRSAVWQSYRWEADLEFPDYRRTPEPMRDLIDRCTRGRRGVLSRLIVRDGSQLVLRQQGPAAAESDIRRVAKEWWLAEIKTAEEFLNMRGHLMAQGEWEGNYFQRPTVSDVVEELRQFQKTMMH
jgi:Protein tyrosine and serine/threonine kinase